MLKEQIPKEKTQYENKLHHYRAANIQTFQSLLFSCWEEFFKNLKVQTF